MYVDVQNKGDKAWSRDFYSNHSHGNDGVIVAAENFKELDKNVSGKTLFPSEVLWQSYLIATEETGASPAKLKLVIRYCVVNEATLSIIRQAEEKSTCTGLKSPDLGGRIYHRQDAGYFAIWGSPNGASTARMLLDHSSEIGFRMIHRVEVLACGDVKQMENPKQSRTIAMFLTDPVPKRASRIGKPTFWSGRPRRLLARKSEYSTPIIHPVSFFIITSITQYLICDQETLLWNCQQCPRSSFDFVCSFRSFLTEPPFFLPLRITQEGARGRAALSHKPIYWLSSSSKKPSVRPQLLALAQLSSSSSSIFFFLNTTLSDGFFPPPRHYNRKRNKKNKIDVTLQSNYKAQSHRRARGSPVFWHLGEDGFLFVSFTTAITKVDSRIGSSSNPKTSYYRVTHSSERRKVCGGNRIRGKRVNVKEITESPGSIWRPGHKKYLDLLQACKANDNYLSSRSWFPISVHYLGIRRSKFNYYVKLM